MLLLIIFGVWLAALSVAFLWIFAFIKKLTKGSKETTLIKILEKILTTQNQNLKEINLVQKEIEKLEDEGRFHVQKVGVIRFNPFKEIGGDHSFSLALLNAKDSGVVITCLHTRERTRVYMKAIKNSKGEHELSDEEKKALKEAQSGYTIK
ncbi:MAG: DUF4446 family protein [bacterium]|nr:DUF4446 family protein [bacterium]